MPVHAIEWDLVGSHVTHILIAYLLAVPIGWDRQRSHRRFGLRTFPLVAMAACGLTLVGMEALTDPQAESRVIQGILTGIGFVGGGAILQQGENVHGTATAASIWNTAAIGIAVALGRLEIALVLSVMNFVTLRFVGRLEHRLHADPGVDDED